MAEPAHSVEITREAGQGLYCVRIEPEADHGQWSATYVHHRAAYGYACGIRMVKGWPIVDRTEAAAQDAAAVATVRDA